MRACKGGLCIVGLNGGGCGFCLRILQRAQLFSRSQLHPLDLWLLQSSFCKLQFWASHLSDKQMCFLLRLQEGEPGIELLSVTAPQLVVSWVARWSVGQKVCYWILFVSRNACRASRWWQVHWESILDKDGMIHTLVKIVDVPVVCLVTLFFLRSGYPE